MRKWTVLLLLILVGCAGTHQLSQGRAFRVSPITWNQLPGWQEDHVIQALPALKKSCVKPQKGYESFCNHLKDVSDDKSLRSLMEKTLLPYRVQSYGKTTGKITGYYEASLTGTRYRQNGAQVPIYGLPDGYKNGETYATRKSIYKNSIDAPIIAWADNEIDLFIMHVQGSGRVITPDGEVIHLGFAGSNGRKFKGLGAIMIEEGISSENTRSMPNIREWCLNHPKEAHDLMMENDRFIFFKELYGETPIGSAGIALTPQRSLAVDTTYIPMHTPMWLETTTPAGTPMKRLMVAQDTGAAIKGGIRADFFWGYGKEAFEIAGHMNQTGQYYLLLPR